MGRRSRAEALIEEFAGEPEGPGRYLVAYDFRGRVSNRFLANLRRVLGRRGGGRPIQRSVVLVSSARAARIVAALVGDYGGEAVPFMVEGELEP